MLFRHHFRTAVSSLVLILAACQDKELPTASQSHSQAEDAVEASGRHERFIKRFELSTAVEGSLRPGQSLVVRVNVKANIESPNTVVDILLPEIEIARLNEGSLVKGTYVGRRLNSQFTRTSTLRAGARFTEGVEFTFPSPGHYRISVKAHQPQAEAFHDAVPVQNTAVDEFWVWISTTGGKVTRDFERQLFPAGYLQTPGPLTAAQLNGPVVPDVDVQRYLDEYCVQGTVSYTDRDTNTQTGLADALLDIVIKDKVYGDQRVFLQTTDAGGYQHCYEADSSSWADIVVYLEGTHAVDADSIDHVGRAVGTGTLNILTVHNARSHVFRNLYFTAKEAINVFGIGAPRVKFEVDTANTGIAAYLGMSAGILITQNSVWNEYGRYVQSHEYGHHFDLANLGLPETSVGTCDSDGDAGHRSWETEWLSCAFGEGWADYFAVVTRGSTMPSYTYEMENSSGLGNQDGSLIEFAVGGFMLDMTDNTPTETGDSYSFPGSYIIDVLATCEVQTSGMWSKRNGIDHAVYCFEGQVDSAITGSSLYFIARGSDPTTQRHTASTPSGWSSAAVRGLWRKNLYNNR